MWHLVGKSNVEDQIMELSLHLSNFSKNAIRHEASLICPHHNGSAERTWRTEFDIYGHVQFRLLPLSVIDVTTGVLSRLHINMLTGKKPELSKMRAFGSEC